VLPAGFRRIVTSVLLVALCSVSSNAIADLDDVVEQLVQDILASQSELSAVQATISQERGALSDQVREAQDRVLDLRERAVAARRLADEDTLTLNQLESRLESWREQSLFQGRLLAGYLVRSGGRSAADSGGIDLSSDLQVLASLVDGQAGRLYPDWANKRLVLPNGEVEDSDLLAIGPVQWFRLSDSQAGLVRTDQGVTRTSVEFDGAAQSGIESLFLDSSGVVTFDPTLSRALLLAQNQETLLQHLSKGGIWVIPILLFAIVATSVSVLKAIFVYRLPTPLPLLAERAKSALVDSGGGVKTLLDQVSGPQGELLHVALSEGTTAEREDRLFTVLLEQRNLLERWLGAIALTASVSPLLGLLGTVSGMITTFRLMTLFGAGDPGAVSSGISEALVTTELGLVVAIPALLAHALLSRKVKAYFAQLENDAVNLSRLMVEPA
jgi:biopolymer transport protein ExbB